MKKEDAKRSRLSCILISGAFIGFTAFFTLGTIFMPDRKFSQMENRPLAQKPQISGENVISGQFGQDTEKYMSDQIILKDGMVKLKTGCDRLMGRTLINGVYFGDDGYMLQRYSENEAQLTENAGAIKAFADSCTVPVDMILSPNSICLNANKLPSGAVSDDQLKSVAKFNSLLGENIEVYNAFDDLKALENSGIQAFYRTDHHWTSSAARAVCDGWLESIGESGTDAAYEYVTVPGFYGTLYSKAPSPSAEADEFGYYINPDGKYNVEFILEQEEMDGFIDGEKLSEKDKYGAFFGGNYALMKITSNAPGGKKLLVLKDSYANAMLPLLADKYSEIWVMDLRYCKTMTASEVIEQNGIERVLMIYNLDFLNEDKNFVWLG